MRRFFKLTSTYQRAVLILTAVLLVSIPVFVAGLDGIRDFRPQAATTDTFSSSVNTGVWQANSYPPETAAGGWCGAGTGNIGQAFASGTYYSMRSSVAFNTSSIPSGSSISSVTLRLNVTVKNTVTSFTFNVRNGSGGTCSNWGGNPPTANLVGTKSSGSIPGPGGSFDVTINNSVVNIGGTTSFILSTNREESDSLPSGSEGFSIETGNSSTRPKLIVTYSEPASPPTVNLSASPTSVSYGGSTTLSWSTTNSPTSCSASGGWSGSKSASGGTQTISNLTSNTTFNLSCSNNAGSASDSVTVNVSAPPPPPTPPTVNLSASHTSISSGSSSTLSWSSSNANSCSASGAWSGSKSLNGSQSTGSLSGPNSFTYTLTCSNNAGSASDSVTVNVSAPPPPPPPEKPTVNLSASPTSISSGQSSTLSWSSTNATSVTISPGVGTFGASGSKNVSPTSSTTYQAVASGPGGNSDPDFASVIVNSEPPPPPPPKPTLSFSANPTSITSGESSTLSWSSSNATSVTITPDIGTVGPNGSTKVSPSSSISYTAVASGAGGNSNPKSVSITVNGVPPPPPPPPPTTPIGSGIPTLPPPSSGIPGFGNIDPDVLAEIEFDVRVPFLLGELAIPAVIGGFSQEITISPGTSKYPVNVSGAKFNLGENLSVLIGGNKTLTKKLNVKTKAQRQPVRVGNLFLGDITGDNVINADDTTAFLSAVSNQAPLADINLDGVGNSMDWAVIRAHFGKKGQK